MNKRLRLTLTFLGIIFVIGIVWYQLNPSRNEIQFQIFVVNQDQPKKKPLNQISSVKKVDTKKNTDNKTRPIARSVAQRTVTPSPREIRPRPVRRSNINFSDFAVNLDQLPFKDGFYRFEEIHAIKEGDELPSEYQLIETKLGHHIIKTNLTPSNAAAVVLPEGSQSVAIFTGVLKIKFKDYQTGQGLLNDYPGFVTEEYAYISSLLFQMDSYEQTIEAYQQLKNHPEVENVEYELLQYARVPK